MTKEEIASIKDRVTVALLEFEITTLRTPQFIVLSNSAYIWFCYQFATAEKGVSLMTKYLQCRLIKSFDLKDHEILIG